MLTEARTEVGLLMIVLEISVIVLSVVAFVVFDLYARACDRI
jgi:hypothetical protein